MAEKKSELDSVFEALANKHRRSLVHRLSLMPASISELANEHNLSLPAIHKHIRILEEAKLLTRKKSGRSNFLALSREGLRLLQDWVSQYHSYWGSDKETLENYISGIEHRKRAIKKKQ